MSHVVYLQPCFMIASQALGQSYTNNCFTNYNHAWTLCSSLWYFLSLLWSKYACFTFKINFINICNSGLTYWGRVTNICITNLGHRWFRIWPVACSVPAKPLSLLLPVSPLGTNFSQILFEFQIFPFKKMHFEMSSECIGHFVSASKYYYYIVA